MEGIKLGRDHVAFLIIYLLIGILVLEARNDELEAKIAEMIQKKRK